MHSIPSAVQVGRDPTASQVTVVDPGRIGVHQRESGAVDGQQFFHQRVGKRRRAGSLAEHGGGQPVLDGASDVEVECSEVGHRSPGVVSELVLGLSPQRGLRSTEPEQTLGGDRGEVGNILGQSGFHQWSPNVSRATSIRCTSMVPEATVAAWA